MGDKVRTCARVSAATHRVQKRTLKLELQVAVNPAPSQLAAVLLFLPLCLFPSSDRLLLADSERFLNSGFIFFPTYPHPRLLKAWGEKISPVYSLNHQITESSVLSTLHQNPRVTLCTESGRKTRSRCVKNLVREVKGSSKQIKGNQQHPLRVFSVLDAQWNPLQSSVQHTQTKRSSSETGWGEILTVSPFPADSVFPVQYLTIQQRPVRESP